MGVRAWPHARYTPAPSPVHNTTYHNQYRCALCVVALRQHTTLAAPAGQRPGSTGQGALSPTHLAPGPAATAPDARRGPDRTPVRSGER